MNDPKQDGRDGADADPHGRDHSDGPSGATERDDVEKGERFANSRDEGVVDKHNYLDDVGEAVASTLGSVAGVGPETDDKIDEKQRGGDPKTARPGRRDDAS